MRLGAVGAALRLESSRHLNLRQVIARLNQVEFRFVAVVVACDVLLGDVYFRGDFLMQDLVGSERSTDVTFEIIERELPFL